MSESIARLLHEAYERQAVENGWETQVASRKFWDEVPEANRNTMIAMVEEVFPSLMISAYAAGYITGVDDPKGEKRHWMLEFHDWFRKEYP